MDTAKSQTAYCYANQESCETDKNIYGNDNSICAPNSTMSSLNQTRSENATTPQAQRAEKKRIEEEQRRENASGNPIFGGFSWLLAPLNWIAQIVFYVAGIFLTYMAKIMSWSVSVSIDSTMLGSLTFVNKGWTAIRDFANMFFIFGLLYIAIQTILGLAGGNTKRALAHIIIAAILVNFSLFATKVVIDAGNILAVSIWSKIQTGTGPAQIDSASKVILGGLDLQTIFDRPENKATLKAMGNGEEMLVHAGGAIFMFIAGYIFLAAALMMVTRTIMLLLLMVFSPFAFMSFGLPKMEQYGHQWLDKLIKQTFVAPIFIFMLYLNSIIINSGDLFSMSGSKGQSFVNAFIGSGEYQIIFNFILMIGFLIASLSIANSYAGDVGSHARGWAKSATKWAGGLATAGAVGTGALAMRQTLGKVGMMGKDNKELHEAAAKGGLGGAIARGKIAMYGGMARATYDPRATKYGAKALSGFGKIDIGQPGGKGGFEATGSTLSKATVGLWGYTGTEHDKEVLEIAERRYKNDPRGKEAYLRANLGSVSTMKDGKYVGANLYEKAKSMIIGTSRYETDTAFKATREAVATETRTKVAKQTLKDEPSKYDGAKADKARLESEKIRAGTAWTPSQEKTLIDAGTQMSSSAKEIASAIKQLTAQDIVDIGEEKMRHEAFVQAYNGAHIQGFNRMAQEGKINNSLLMGDIGYGVLANGTDAAKTSIRNLSKNGQSAFPFDFKKDMADYLGEYQARQTAGTLSDIHTGSGKTYGDYLKHSIGKTTGYMGAESIGGLEEDQITSDLVIPHLTQKSLQEFVRLNKVEGKFDQTFFDELKHKIVGNPVADPRAEKYINNAAKGTPFNP